ncbi:MAG: carbamoyltransferase HypF [Catonella sp.]|jgi:hydrogenase maturation protein HypF|nr:carbamoyltransferase HypF [Catonella sp.]MDY6356900.1 carbamoyltransferase HypF [Catonella sp.]
MKHYAITVTGLVQGVGMRPFVAETAEKYGITGSVRNSGGIVNIDAFCKSQFELEGLMDSLAIEKPAEAEIKDLYYREINDKIAHFPNKFEIVKSYDIVDDKVRYIPVDTAPCPDCERELKDPDNRRFHYPFISCTKCGPRFSIIDKLPYDRESTSMSDFKLCGKCKAEYNKKGNIRRYAQTIACPDCGPHLYLYSAKDGDLYKSESDDDYGLIEETADCLREGSLALIKGTGGFHLACDACNASSVREIRRVKERPEKPFAVMFRNIEEIKEYCELSKAEEKLLRSPARPIVLLRKKADGKKIADNVCGKSDKIGAMLPSDPILILLLELIHPLLMTSGNTHGQPLLADGEEAVDLLLSGDFCDIMLDNDREILNALDDSVVKSVKINKDKTITQFIRRARGYVPSPIKFADEDNSRILAAGGDLKNSFAIAKDGYAYLSGYYGDLSYEANLTRRTIDRNNLIVLTNVPPKTLVYDMHPGYISSDHAKKLARSESLKEEKVFHHEAHIASVMAENFLADCFGLSFDGTGYGLNAKSEPEVWGGEFYAVKNNTFTRAGHISSVPMLSGDKISKEADNVFHCYVYEALKRKLINEDDYDMVLKYSAINTDDKRLIFSAIDNNINIVNSSSMGRLFDAVSALLNVCHVNSYEGECATLLEQRAEKGSRLNFEPEELETSITESDGVFAADTVSLFAHLIKMKVKKERSEKIALTFHKALAKMSVNMVLKMAEKYPGIKRNVALSGGTFYNEILLRDIYNGLTEKGFNVYTNESVPCGDGGLALGQCYIASKR